MIVHIKIMKRILLIWLLALAAVNAFAFSITNKTLNGVFMLSKQAGFQWDTLELTDGHFRFWHAGDVIIQGVDTMKYPIEGTYKAVAARLLLSSGKSYGIHTVKSTVTLWAPRAEQSWQEHKMIDVYAIFLPVENIQSGKPDLDTIFTPEERQRSIEAVQKLIRQKNANKTNGR